MKIKNVSKKKNPDHHSHAKGWRWDQGFLRLYMNADRLSKLLLYKSVLTFALSGDWFDQACFFHFVQQFSGRGRCYMEHLYDIGTAESAVK